jgi:RNA polymerase sigma-70 factor (ECF subfamily)
VRFIRCFKFQKHFRKNKLTKSDPKSPPTSGKSGGGANPRTLEGVSQWDIRFVLRDRRLVRFSVVTSLVAPKIVTDPSDSIESSVSSMTSGWLDRATHGDNDAWKRLESAYRGLVCWWCRKCGVPVQDIDDLAQDVFTALAQSLPTFDHRSFRGFLWTITRNKIHDYWRQCNREPLAPGGSSLQVLIANVEAESSHMVGSVDTATKIVFDAVVRVIQQEFSATQWNAFWQFAVEGRRAAGVAMELGITRNQVYLAKSRILRRIRVEFDGTSNIPPQLRRDQ